MPRLVALTVENFKRVTAVALTFDPDTHALCIGGNNAQGKSSVLDAVEAAFCGGRALPEAPIHSGRKSARIVAETDALVIERRFTASGSTLTVKGRDGVALASPQAVLDELLGPSRLAFDPEQFVRFKPVEQADTLRKVLGLDFTEIERSREDAFDKRTDLSRQLRSAEALLAAARVYPDTPKEEVSVVQLMERLGIAEQANKTNDSVRAHLARAGTVLDEKTAALRALLQERTDLETRLRLLSEKSTTAEDEVDMATAHYAAAGKDVEALKDVDTAALRQEVALADDTNRRVRANAECAKVSGAVANLREAVEQKTREIEALDAKKAEALTSATFPVEGLGFTIEGHVTFQGVPFEQASQAERLRVSMAMALAMHPGLKVALIRDGSHLDNEALRAVSDMAEEAGALVLIERVGAGPECGIVIEDGEVVGAAANG